MNMHYRILLFLLILLYACTANEPDQAVQEEDIPESSFSDDTLHVATLYSPVSYFVFGDEILGRDAEKLGEYAEYAKRPVKFYVADNQQDMIQLLEKGMVDLIAAPVFQTNELNEKFAFVSLNEDSYLVLVQQIGFNTVTNISELNGRKVHVTAHSTQAQRLENLNKEIGGGIEIIYEGDSVTEDKLIEKVIRKEIGYTLAYHRTTEMYKENNRKFDNRVRVGFNQKNGWLVRKDAAELIQDITEWENRPETPELIAALDEKYQYRNPYFARGKINIPRGSISPYDAYFRKYALEILWDWHMLAAIAFHESGFDSSRVSYKGASGLMQLMPRTAANFGLNRKNVLNPEKNIEAGVQYIKSLNMLFRKIENKDERIKFILASYNSGPAHILDAMALASKYGKNPHLWFGNVEYYLSKKNEPEFYRDEVCKYGSFRAGTTIQYVKNTLNTYHKFKGGS